MVESRTQGALGDRQSKGDLKPCLSAKTEKFYDVIKKKLTIQLEHLHSFSSLIPTNKPHTPRGLELLDILRFNLVPMPMPLPSNVPVPIQPPKLALLRVGLKDGRSKTKTHGTAHVGLGYFGHETDDRVRRVGNELGRVGLLETANVSGPFDDGDLETEADTEVWDVLLTRPLGSGNHALGTSKTETTGDNNTPVSLRQLVSIKTGRIHDLPGGANGLPGVMEFDGVLSLHSKLQVGRVNPLGLSQHVVYIK